MRQRFYKSKIRAFTIIELLVAASITVLLVGLMLQVTLGALSSWSRSSGTLISKNEAQTALDYLARDLASAVWKRDNNVWLIATIQRDQSGINSGRGDADVTDANWSPQHQKPGSATPGTAGSSLQLEPSSGALEDYRFGQAGLWLRMFTRQQGITDDAVDGSAPVAVGYQIVRMKVGENSSEYRYTLFRAKTYTNENTSPERSAFDFGYDLTSVSTLTSSYNALDVSGAGTKGDPEQIRRPNRFYNLANNVVDFGVRFWAFGANGQLNLLFPATDSPGYAPDDNTHGFAATTRTGNKLVQTGATTYGNVSQLPYWDNSRQMRYGFPDVADIFLRILTEDGARQLEAFENGNSVRPPNVATDDEYWWQLVEQNSTVYTQRVTLHPPTL